MEVLTDFGTVQSEQQDQARNHSPSCAKTNSKFQFHQNILTSVPIILPEIRQLTAHRIPSISQTTTVKMTRKFQERQTFAEELQSEFAVGILLRESARRIGEFWRRFFPYGITYVFLFQKIEIRLIVVI